MHRKLGVVAVSEISHVRTVPYPCSRRGRAQLLRPFRPAITLVPGLARKVPVGSIRHRFDRSEG